jgi:DNA-binding CsgD family transcriptional regulator
MNVGDGDFEAVARLWHELAAFPASRIDAALAHCLRELTKLLGATNGLWVGVVREDEYPPDDELAGWRPRATGYLHFSAEREQRVTALLRDQRAGRVDPQTISMVARSGTTRACLRSELVPDDVWRKSRLYNEVLHPLGVEDRLMGSHVIDARHESYMALDRGAGDPPFAERERDVFALFLHGSPAFQSNLMRSHGLLGAQAALAPREREILQMLLTNRTERDIAEELKLTEPAVHQYVVSILRTFGVKRRVGLMARWLCESHDGAKDGRRAADSLKSKD